MGQFLFTPQGLFFLSDSFNWCRIEVTVTTVKLAKNLVRIRHKSTLNNVT